MNKLKNNEKYNVGCTNFKGITLVALVITIIVLIILAGVTINAVMNGGLIINAKSAKNQYEEGKVKEEWEISDLESKVIDLEVEEDLKTIVTNGYKNGVEDISMYSPYIFKNGYLTGIEIASDTQPEAVESVNNKLPVGYRICTIDGEDISNTAISVSTGMVIKNNDKEVGRVIVFGDIDYVAGITVGDMTTYTGIKNKKIEVEDYQIVAIDLNHDKKIDYHDLERLTGITAGRINAADVQRYEAQRRSTIAVIFNEEAIDEYIAAFNKESDTYSIEWDEQTDRYILKGITAQTDVTTLNAILDKLPFNSYVKRKGKTTYSKYVEEGEILSDDAVFVYYEYNDGDSQIELLQAIITF